MTAALRRPALRALVTALAALLLAWTAGGQALLGRIDPALTVPLLLVPMLGLGWWQRDKGAALRWRTMVLALAILALLQALLAAALAGMPVWSQLAVTALAGSAAGLVADLFFRWRAPGRALRWAIGFALVVGWFAGGHALLAALYRPATAPPGAAAVTLITGLPLRWANGGDIAATIAHGTADDPALDWLEAMGPVALVDSLVDHVPPPGGTLLLAHPRALAPQELVAIDAFVRGGGRAVILADALSGWPTHHPLGDPRNPPVTSLLTPLLDHWGVTLSAAPVGETRAHAADVEGARLRLFSAGRFDALPSECRAFAERRIASCAIGQGSVWLVGDADLLFAPLWQPLVTGAPHLRRADTMDWLAVRLWGEAARDGIRLRPVWIRRSEG